MALGLNNKEEKMDTRFYFSRCSVCGQKALLVFENDSGSCKGCTPELFESVADLEKDAWLRGDLDLEPQPKNNRSRKTS